MPWQNLGTFSVEYDWQETGQLLVTAETFRVTQDWDGEYVGEGKLLFRFEYPDGSFSDYRSIYPTKDSTLIEIPIPEAFKRVGLVSRRLRLKRSQWSKVFYDKNWTATIEAFVEDAGDGTPAQVIDGGEDV